MAEVLNNLECPASGLAHSFGKNGPNGEIQCAYCGNAPIRTPKAPQPVRWKGMCVVAEYVPEFILARRGNHHATFTVGGEEFRVQMDDSRYRVFGNSLKCVECGLTGTIMRLEYSRHPRGLVELHFNLYAFKRGHAVLMTQDHITPRSKGGEDVDENLQTMCVKCNEKKGNKLTSEGAERHRLKNRDKLLSYLHDVIDGNILESRMEAEKLLLALADDDKITARWMEAARLCGWGYDHHYPREREAAG